MSKELRMMLLRNRIHMLRQRTDRDNNSVIRKLERQLRNLEKAV